MERKAPKSPVFTQMLLNLDERLFQRDQRPPAPPKQSTEWSDVTKLTIDREAPMAVPAAIKPKFFAVPLRGLELESTAKPPSIDEDMSDADSDESSLGPSGHDSTTLALDDLTYAFYHIKESAYSAFMQCVMEDCTLATWLSFFTVDERQRISSVPALDNRTHRKWLDSHQSFLHNALQQTIIDPSPQLYHFIHSVSGKCSCS